MALKPLYLILNIFFLLLYILPVISTILLPSAAMDYIRWHGLNLHPSDDLLWRAGTLSPCICTLTLSCSLSPLFLIVLSIKFSSFAQWCPTLCDPMHRSTPGLPVHHQLPEFTQTHVHRVSDAIQPSHPLSSPSPPAPNPSQHQSLFQWVNSSHEVAKVLEFQL